MTDARSTLLGMRADALKARERADRDLRRIDNMLGGLDDSSTQDVDMQRVIDKYSWKLRKDGSQYVATADCSIQTDEQLPDGMRQFVRGYLEVRFDTYNAALKALGTKLVSDETDEDLRYELDNNSWWLNSAPTSHGAYYEP